MQRECIKCGHVNEAASGQPSDECPRCGAIYAKARPRGEVDARRPPRAGPVFVLSVLAATLVIAFAVGTWLNRSAPDRPAAALVGVSNVKIEADRCLDLHRLMLRDPRSAYWSSPAKSGYDLSITVHATNAFGGFMPKRARCWVHDGTVDSGLSLGYASEDGWIRP